MAFGFTQTAQATTVEGTTSGPSAPGSFATLPEMTTSFVPAGTSVWLYLECTVQFAPTSAGDSVHVDLRLALDGTPISGSTRRVGMVSASILSLIPGTTTQVASLKQRIDGLTPGTASTVTAEWMLVAGSTGTAIAYTTERHLTVSDTL